MSRSSESLVTAVLLALWRSGNAAHGDITMEQMLQETGAALPEVQQALETLTQRRCIIERTPAGLRLASTALACWPDILGHIAHTENLRLGRRVMVFHRTTSTNDVAWQCASAPENDGLIVAADEQTAGRGRLGRAWFSKPGQSILLSLLLRDMSDASIDRLTLLAGLAAATAVEIVLRRATGNAPRIEIKWPNDLMIHGKKLAGILVERRAHVVIGIGINVSQAAGDFSLEASRPISLYEAGDVLVDRLRLASELIRQLDARCLHPAADDSWLAEWKSRCNMLGAHIRVRTHERLLSGTVVDVAPLHGLILRDDAGATHWLSAQTSTIESLQ